MPDVRQQSEAVAKWCGWTEDEDGFWWEKPDGESQLHLPNYSEDLNEWHRVEAMLAERGLMEKYIEALRNMWFETQGSHDYFEFLIRATPAQRLEAAYRTIQEAALGKVMEEERHA